MQTELKGRTIDVDRRTVLVHLLVPSIGTFLAMAIGFALVGGILLVREGLLIDSLLTQVLALSMMYLVPHFVVGLGFGVRLGFSPGPAIAAGLTPIVVLVLALGLFGGPMLTPFQVPGVMLLAILIWAGVCALGLVTGEKVVAPRLATWRED
jgi:hypothetical protein